MGNVFTLMIFPIGQPQAVVLQYQTLMAVTTARDTIDGGGSEKVTITDDFGRVLRLAPADVQLSLIQDVDRATDGNVILQVKGNLTQALTQVQMQDAINADPKLKAAATRASLMQGVPPGGAFRA